MKALLKRLKDNVMSTDLQTVFISFISMLAVVYYANPLFAVSADKWDRTFSTAIMSGISIDKRISHLYLLFLVVIPVIFAGALLLYNFICKHRPTYKDFFVKYNTIAFFAIAVSYISRYVFNSNIMLEGIIGFYAIIMLVALWDKSEKKDFTALTNIFVRYMAVYLTVNLFLNIGKHIPLIMSVLVVCVYEFVSTVLIKKDELKELIDYWVSFFTWIPAIMRFVLELIYIGIERGATTQNYLTIIVVCLLGTLLLALVASVLIRKKKLSIDTFSHIGIIISMGAVVFFNYAYQFVWSYSGPANLYELGNATVTADMVLNGKLPVADFFSAHAISDIFTRGIYCVIHNDINGLLVNPYSGIAYITMIILLYIIVRSLFDRNIAILFICLFPISVIGIKMTSFCFLPIVMMLYIIKKPEIKAYVSYWIITLFCAFYAYDEGVLLGIGSILAFCTLCVLNKEWKKLKKYVLSGVSVGAVAGIGYVVYALITGIPVVKRIKEWIAVGIKSNSTWALTNFGNIYSFDFLVAYIVVPIITVFIIGMTIFYYAKHKKASHIAALIFAFGVAQLLFIPRGVVFHNLELTKGTNGIVLNFIHWTVALFVLFMSSTNEMKSTKRRLLSWATTFFAIIILEGGLVTEKFPNQESVLLGNALQKSTTWHLSNNNPGNVGQKRIVFDQKSIQYIDRFKLVFDSLLTENQTFVDFANVTSLYFLTERTRPSYVAQTPSLLTTQYSQQCYLEQISGYDCPLAIIGTTEQNYVQQMTWIPHNVRYFKIAEHIYRNYRPLVNFDEYSIWCANDKYDEYKEKLSTKIVGSDDFELVDYGYDATSEYTDVDGNIKYQYKPYHSFGSGKLAYVWANFDEAKAINNNVIIQLKETTPNVFEFEGSQSVLTDKGNYVAIECTNSTGKDESAVIIFQDSKNSGARFQYAFTVVPGTANYLIRASQDYFWDIYNIDTISVFSENNIKANSLRVLEGD